MAQVRMNVRWRGLWWAGAGSSRAGGVPHGGVFMEKVMGSLFRAWQSTVFKQGLRPQFQSGQADIS